ncbi:aromatic amino acid transaminase [Chlamydiifrater phoenicopteri]|uniref:aromatic amino acid transaminase n=1 Tax=Chlamydiifrater phoenicopteri TaxID=2681469 RepID=UPI001BCBA10F|nr:aromatic amino acid transaminase [Chlamydiifrater phoenicopteri]
MNFFSELPSFPPDAIFGLDSAFKEDPREEKIDLLIGVYVHPTKRFGGCSAIKKAMTLITEEETNKLYLPIEGFSGYIDEMRKMVFGSNDGMTSIFSCQSLGGTGALHLAAILFATAPEVNKHVYISEQSWGNHERIFSNLGLGVSKYPYYDPDQQCLKINEFFQFLKGVPEKSVILFQCCCHNPTGTDFSKSQWEEIAQIVKTKSLFPIIDMAYQGFGDGLESDRFPVELFVNREIPVAVAACSSKNFCLYGERVGMFAIYCLTEDSVKKVSSLMKEKIRGEYSNPPRHGALIVNTIMKNPYLRQEWRDELEEMRSAMNEKRKFFVEKLSAECKGAFDYILNQKGFFGYPAFSKEQVDFLREQYAIYTAPGGRFNLNGITEKNVAKIVKGFAEAYAQHRIS